MSTQAWSDSDKSRISAGWLQRLAASLGFTNAASLRETLKRAIGEAQYEDDASMSPQERTMLLNVLGFGEARVAEVMIPRADIVAIEDDRPVAALFELFTKIGHSRVPVFRSSLDNPVGMVHIKDAMAWALREKLDRVAGDSSSESRLEFRNGELGTTIADAKLVREVLFVPPSMTALALLAKMKAKRIHLALVVDEFGGTDGLVTFEDLAEEIIGDIADEHDVQDMYAIGREGGAFVASARTPIEDVEQVLGHPLTLPGADRTVETLGGLILSMVGSIPKRGQIIPHPSGVAFEILEAGPRRLLKVRILRQRGSLGKEDPPGKSSKRGEKVNGVKAA
jgi:hemolysin (HlyC) family protein